MVDNSVFNLDGKNYLVIDTIKENGIKYVYLSNEKDVNDFLVQKEIKEEDKTYLVNLETEEEYNSIVNEMRGKAMSYGYNTLVNYCKEQAAIRNGLQEPLR